MNFAAPTAKSEGYDSWGRGSKPFPSAMEHGECCKLPQRDPGRPPEFYCILLTVVSESVNRATWLFLRMLDVELRSVASLF